MVCFGSILLTSIYHCGVQRLQLGVTYLWLTWALLSLLCCTWQMSSGLNLWRRNLLTSDGINKTSIPKAILENFTSSCQTSEDILAPVLEHQASIMEVSAYVTGLTKMSVKNSCMMIDSLLVKVGQSFALMLKRLSKASHNWSTKVWKKFMQEFMLTLS